MDSEDDTTDDGPSDGLAPWEVDPEKVKRIARTGPVREFMASQKDKDVTYRRAILQALADVAVDPKNHKQIRAAELLLNYDLGKPVETIIADVTTNDKVNADPVQGMIDAMLAKERQREGANGKGEPS